MNVWLIGLVFSLCCHVIPVRLMATQRGQGVADLSPKHQHLKQVLITLCFCHDSAVHLNRGATFSLQCGHLNCVAGGKRLYHTIIPALLTDAATNAEKSQLLAALGVMGAFMQPQGHIQVLLNMLEFGMNPQQALDAPRIFVQYEEKTNQWLVNLEEGIDQEVAVELRRRGHRVNWPVTGHQRAQFGRGQIIAVGDWWNPSVAQTHSPCRVLWAGSDPRADGCAQGY